MMARRLISGFALLSVMVCAAGSAFAQGKLEAKYEVSLGGITIGKGGWTVSIAEDDYSAAVSGATTGLMKAIGGGGGTANAKGKVSNGQLVPATYLTSIMYGTKNETIRINLAGGNIKDFAIEPEPPVNPERIVVTEAQKRGVLDPMTGSLLYVAGTADPVAPEACRGKASIFDGRMRYDLQLDYKRMETVTIGKGAQIPTVVCAVTFLPISGYVPSRYAIKYLASLRDMDIAFAQIAGTRVLAPLKVRIPTPVGTGVLEATEFNTAPLQRTAKTN